MNTILPLILMGLAGLLAGGAWSLHRQGAGRVPVLVLAVLATAALAGGIAWLWPAGGEG
jgi:hypothetical protein